MELVGLWVAALLTLAIFSFLYRDNPVYRFAEHLLVGVSAGYYLVQYCVSALYRKLFVPVVQDGHHSLLIGGLLGALMLFRFAKRTEWLSRFALAFYVGTAAGYTIPSIMNSQVLAQVQGTWLTPLADVTWWGTAKEITVLLGVVCVLVYFYFSKAHTGVLGTASRVGIVFLMIGFGASFGYTVMGRVSLLIGQITFLLKEFPRSAFGG
jgi:hypothetical protein